jgi:hypothetical protein
VGIALDPLTSPSHFVAANLSEGMVDLRIDIRDRNQLEEALLNAQPDFVFHLAAQALVRVFLEGGSALQFCGHHFKEHEVRLRAVAIDVQDETHQLDNA